MEDMKDMAWLCKSIVKGFPYRVRRYRRKTPWGPGKVVHVMACRNYEEARQMRDLVSKIYCRGRDT